MWLLRIILFVALLALLVFVALDNGQTVEVVKLFGHPYEGVRLFVVMYLSALVGFVVGLILLAVRETQLRMRLSRERKQRALMEREVRQLRAAPLEDLPPTRNPRPREAEEELS